MRAHQTKRPPTCETAWLTALAIAFLAVPKAAELALLTDCTLPPCELATALATALVLAGLATGCACMQLHRVLVTTQRMCPASFRRHGH